MIEAVLCRRKNRAMGKWIGFSVGFNAPIVGDPSSGITTLRTFPCRDDPKGRELMNLSTRSYFYKSKERTLENLSRRDIY
jgi:hypothetical protein